MRRLLIEGLGVLHDGAPLCRLGRFLTCVVIWVVTLGLVVLVPGCDSGRELPVYAWETPQEALGVLGTQNNGLVTFEAVMEEDSGLEGEGGLPCEARVSFHLYAWQHEKVRVDLEKDGKVRTSAIYRADEVIFVDEEGRPFTGMTFFSGEPGWKNPEEVAPISEACVLFRRGIFRDSPKYQGLDHAGLMVWRCEPGGVTCRVDSVHLTAKVYELYEIGHVGCWGGLARMELSDYQTKGGIAWPTRMKVESSLGRVWNLRMKWVKINEDLPAGVFETTPKAGE